jgi:hypothetical protein
LKVLASVTDILLRGVIYVTYFSAKILDRQKSRENGRGISYPDLQLPPSPSSQRPDRLLSAHTSPVAWISRTEFPPTGKGNAQLIWLGEGCRSSRWTLLTIQANVKIFCRLDSRYCAGRGTASLAAACLSVRCGLTDRNLSP